MIQGGGGQGFGVVSSEKQGAVHAPFITSRYAGGRQAPQVGGHRAEVQG